MCEFDVKVVVRKLLILCCRIVFFESFDDKVCFILFFYSCCNVCYKNCKCVGFDCSIFILIFDCECVFFIVDLEKFRIVLEDERLCFKDVLYEV